MKKIIVLFFLFVSFLSSGQEEGTFIVSSGEQKITLVLDTKLPYIELSKPVVFETYFENIDLKKSRTIARGLKKSGRQCDGNCAVWEVLVDEKGVVDGHFKVTFNYRLTEDGKYKELCILIPVK